MKFAAYLPLLASGAAAFSTFAKSSSKSTTPSTYSVDNIPGVVAPTGFFDPLGLAAKADANTLKRYREAEITHGRVAMLATVGFLVGEQVEGSSFLFDASITGPAINHLAQVPAPFWAILLLSIANAEIYRAKLGWVEPENLPTGKVGLLRENYNPGELGFDPLGLAPKDPKAYAEMETKELQNGRLAMLAAIGFMAQELVDGQPIMAEMLKPL